MVQLKKLKLNQIATDDLLKRQMNDILGGGACGCPCYYANYGGSSTVYNGGTNNDNGYNPGYSCNKICTGDTESEGVQARDTNSSSYSG